MATAIINPIHNVVVNGNNYSIPEDANSPYYVIGLNSGDSLPDRWCGDFDLSAIPSGANWNSATLLWYGYGGIGLTGGFTPNPVDILQISQKVHGAANAQALTTSVGSGTLLGTYAHAETSNWDGVSVVPSAISSGAVSLSAGSIPGLFGTATPLTLAIKFREESSNNLDVAFAVLSKTISLAGGRTYPVLTVNYTVGGADTTPPVCTISTPSLAHPSEIIALSYTATDSVAVQDISLSFSVDNGLTYTAIVTNVASTGSYNWPAPNTNSDTVRVKITARDTALNVSTAVTTNAFSVRVRSISGNAMGA